MSPKQQIYQDLLRLVLPHVRNVSSQGPWRRARDRSCYYVAELVHNLFVSLFTPEFVDHDVHFLNHQARWFFEHARATHPLYEPIVECLVRLFEIVPEPMRERLEWSGPPSIGSRPKQGG